MSSTISKPGSDAELARQSPGGELELRGEPVRVRWAFAELVSSDRHDVRCTFECSARAVDDPAERKMFREVLLDGRRRVTAEDVSVHFHQPLRGVVASAVQGSAVSDLLTDAKRDALLQSLRDAAQRVAFACGLELLAPFHLEIESPSYQQTRLREMQRGLAERHAAGQIEHFQRAAELLKQFNAMRESAPELSAGQVLERISPADRGSVLQALLLGSAKQDRATCLWAVAGTSLVQIDGASNPPTTTLIPLLPTLGPLRSVQASRVDGVRVLLIGARAGFLLVRPDNPSDVELYHDPGLESDLGFSRVVYWAETETFVACHGEAGIVRWGRGETASPRFTLRADRLRASYAASGSAAAGPRNLHVLDPARIVFSVGNKLLGMNASEDAFSIPSASESEIVAVVPDDLRILVAHEDGTVCAIDRSTLAITCKQRTGARLRAAGALPWLGSTRLLLSSEDDGAVRCVGLDDPLVTQYGSAHRGARVVAGSADVVAALSADRQRLVLWNTWDGREPAAEIYMTGLTRHRAADLAFG